MFELNVACKYLLPRWRQLSVSIISLISIFVIALVVWLIVVFFSVTHGLEKNWIQKLVAVTAPVRITPTADYYRSYYYLVDGISAQSDYNLKSIQEKLLSDNTDPYDSEQDPEIPKEWLIAAKDPNGNTRDLVKEVFDSIHTVKNIAGLKAQDYEVAYASFTADNPTQTFIQGAFVTTFQENHPLLSPFASQMGDDGILLPKGFKEAGLKENESGWMLYLAPTTSAVQEQRIPVRIVGFYDPGILPMGGKFILASPAIVSVIRSAQQSENNQSSNGISITFDDIMQSEEVKDQLVAELDKRDLQRYWKVESYRDFAPAKDLLQQLHSERTLFSLIATIVIMVACSNIVSLLIILVNDKKEEIGILRAMGASVFSIASIFGVCGLVMGCLGSLIGITLALFTLSHVQTLVDLIGKLQGHELLNPLFYGDQLPTTVSSDALLFVLLSTVCVSVIAGIVPALKACFMQPSQLLRTE